MEEGTELSDAHRQGGPASHVHLPAAPAGINFAEKNFPEILPHISTTRSPQQCFGTMAKTYLAEQMGIDPRKMRVISIMPCTAKKEEAGRSEFTMNGASDVDVVLTTREFARLLQREGIDLASLPASDYDNPWMGEYSGAAAIFGTTGGVMEAALRTVHKVVTGNELEAIEYTAVRGYDEKVREATVDLKNGTPPVKVAVAHSLKAARQMAEAVRDGESPYHFIEIMACPGGCMGGGGQPRSKKAYQAAVGRNGRRPCMPSIGNDPSAQSHNNPQITKLYDEFLEKPNSHKSHDLLHTAYRDRKRVVKHTMKEIWQEIEAR